MAEELLIRNGHVFDPLSGINGDIMDICIRDGIIVDKVSSQATVLDATGKTVMAGGVDIHTHIAGPKVNTGRIMRPEDKLFRRPYDQRMARQGKWMEMGFSVPSTYKTGYSYARMGYVYTNEAAMPPLFAAHVHDEFRHTPIIDQSTMPVFGNNWFCLEYLKGKEIENNAAYIAWLLQATYGFAIKCVNPGGTEAWAWGRNCVDIHDPVPHFDITPAEIITGLIETNEYLGLPHSLHLHGNNFGNPGNYEHTIKTLELARGYRAENRFGRTQVIHNTHLQFFCYRGDSWATIASGAKEVMDFINKTDTITVDLGAVTLDETTTMTADGPFEHHLHLINKRKWVNLDVEVETGSGVVPYSYDRNIYVNGVQWAIGLEIALFSKDLMRVFISTDHPNAGPFTRYPRVIMWLMSKKAREETIRSMKHESSVTNATHIASLERELELYDIAKMTRAGPAQALGLSHWYGSLREGAYGNVAVYDLDPGSTPDDPHQIEKAFAKAAYTIKEGKVVVQEGRIIAEPAKHTIWTRLRVPDNPQVMRDIRNKFSTDYTVNMENYMLKDALIFNPRAVDVLSPE